MLAVVVDRSNRFSVGFVKLCSSSCRRHQAHSLVPPQASQSSAGFTPASLTHQSAVRPKEMSPVPRSLRLTFSQNSTSITQQCPFSGSQNNSNAGTGAIQACPPRRPHAPPPSPPTAAPCPAPSWRRLRPSRAAIAHSRTALLFSVCSESRAWDKAGSGDGKQLFAFGAIG